MSRVAFKSLLHLCSRSNNLACLMLLDIAGPISLSAFKVCERLILSRTRLQLPTICFASTEEGTFHSVLVKKRKPPNLCRRSHTHTHTSRIGYEGGLGPRPAFTSEFLKCLPTGGMTSIRTHKMSAKVRNMKIRGVRRVVEVSTARFSNPFSDNDLPNFQR